MADPLNERDVVEVIVAEGTPEWYVIQKTQPFRFTSATYGSIAVSTSTTTASEAFLNPPSSELIHIIGIGIEGGTLPNHEVQVTLKNPAAVTLFGTSVKPEGGWLNANNSPPHNPAPLDQWVVHERQPAIVFNNQSGVFAITPKLHYWGYRYLVRPMGGDPDTVGTEVHSFLYNKVVDRKTKLDARGAPLVDPATGRVLQEETVRYVPSGRQYKTASIGGFRS